MFSRVRAITARKFYSPRQRRQFLRDCWHVRNLIRASSLVAGSAIAAERSALVAWGTPT